VVLAGLLAGSNLVGDGLYAVLVYVLLVGVAPSVPTTRAAAVAFGICAAVELLQLTGLPAAIVATLPGARLVLGTTFNAPDLLAYAAGVVLATGVDLLVERAALRRRAAVTQSVSGRTPG